MQIGWFILIWVLAAVGAVVATRLHMAIATRVGLVAPADPWHEIPPAQSGGLAMWGVVAVGFMAAGLWRNDLSLNILSGSLVMTLVGWIDDRRPFSPTTKLVLQLLVAVALLASGLADGSRLHFAIMLPLAVMWLVGQSNAVNLLDNMDGCGPVVIFISGLSIAVLQALVGNANMAAFALLISGAAAGFYVFNRKPARVFMGDTGSLSMGLALAAIALNGTVFGDGARLSRFVLPPLVMILPLLNTAFVIVTRFDAGVPVSRGLADHINYRLVAYGYSVQRSLFILMLLGAASGAVAAAWWALPLHVWSGLTALGALGVVYFAIFLSHADVNEMYRRFGIPFKPPRTSDYRLARRRMFELVSDVLIANSAFFFAFQLRFEAALPPAQEINLMRGLPVATMLCVVGVWTSGLYRSFWKYVGLPEMMRLVRACMGIGVVMFGLRMLPWFNGFPRTVCILFPLLFGVLAAGYRLSLRLMHETKQSAARAATAQKVLIVGAGDAGVLALRDLRNSPHVGLLAIGFLDDDVRKLGFEIYGLPVLGQTAVLEKIAPALGVSAVIIAMPSAPQARIQELIQAATLAGVEARVFTPTQFAAASVATPLPARSET